MHVEAPLVFEAIVIPSNLLNNWDSKHSLDFDVHATALLCALICLITA